MGIVSWFKRTFVKSGEICHKVEQIDHKTRDMKHTLRNLAMRSQALHKLVSEMREDGTWRRGERRAND